MQAAPYTIQLDPQVAAELARNGATLLVLNMPECTYIGVDQHGFSVGPKFMGLKMVPPGTHFISYRAVNREDGSLSAATGFFWWAQPREVLVRMWDPATETLIPLADRDEAERYEAGVRRFEFDAHLAPYNLHGLRAWHELSKHITAQHVVRISPVCGNISIMAEAHDEDPHMVAPKTEAENRLADQLIKGRAERAAQQQQQQQPKEHLPQAGTAGMEVDGEGCCNGCPLQGAGSGMPCAADKQSPAGSQGKRQGGGLQAEGTGDGGGMTVDEGAQQGSQGPGGKNGGEGGAGGPERAGVAEQREPGDQAQPSGLAPAACPPAASATGSNAAAAASSSGRCFYTPLPRFVRRPGLSAAQLTAMNMDKTTLLQQVASKHYNGCPEGLLGELQFAFVAFVFGQSLDAYAQWKALLLLFLGCEDAALRTAQPLFVQVLHALRVQLEVSLRPDPSGEDSNQQQMHPFGVPMVEELLPDSFLRHALGSFFQMLQEHGSDVSPDLFREGMALKILLKSVLGWDYDFQVLDGGTAGGGVCSGANGGDGRADPVGADEEGPVVVQDPQAFISL